MTRKRYKISGFWVTVLLVLIVMGVYVDRVIVPTIPPPFVASPTPTRSPESFVTDAEGLFNQGKLLQAIDLYKQAIRANPNDDVVYVALARVQIFAGQYKDAQASAENALLLNEKNSRAHAMQAWSMDYQGDYLKAQAAISRALELDPNNGIAHAINVVVLVDLGTADNLEKAVEESRVALSLAPDSIEANQARGYILEVTANYEEAIAAYQKAIDINANIPDLHLELGINYRAMGVYDKAVDEFTRANTLNPSDPYPDLYISRTYATIGEFAKAAQYAETAVSDSPTDASLRGNYGVMLFHNVDWVEAANQLSLAINGGQTDKGEIIKPIPLTNDTRVAEYYSTFALTLARLNRCGEALQVSQQVLGRVPANETAVANANEAINICGQNALNTAVPATVAAPAATETVTPTP